VPSTAPAPAPAQPEVDKGLPVQPGDLATLGFPREAILFPQPAQPGTWKADISAPTMRVHFEVAPQADEGRAKEALERLSAGPDGAKIEKGADEVTITTEIKDGPRNVLKAKRIGRTIVSVAAGSIADKEVSIAELTERVAKTLGLIAQRTK
jgi:hypothetical protein